MKMIIAGGRDYKFTKKDIEELENLRLSRFIDPIDEVVSGGASGADHEGEAWAATHNIPIKWFLADWPRHGKSAGPIRNRAMAKYADAVALFPGGKGTTNMFNEAKSAGLTIYDFRHMDSST